MGGFGNPRYMCAECEADFEELTLSRDADGIAAARDRIVDKMTKASVDDELTLSTVDEILKSAAQRRDAIVASTYDFKNDEIPEGEDTVPEELRESEEDIEREQQRMAKLEKLDKITNWICIGAIIGVVGFVIYRIFFA
jgi:hypothetical protein